MPEIVVASLYRFVRLEEYRTLRAPLLELMQRNTIRGTLLLAAEGINGTVAGSRQAIDLLVAWLKADPLLADLEYKEQVADEMPFRRAKVRLKNEIVTLGVGGIDPRETVGTYVDPQDWNALISDPDVTVIDTRNDYEVEIGSFPGAVNPNTATFREFPTFAERELDPAKHRKVAMFCTGGIRCEKSTAYLKSRGFDEVYHLKGGILNYLANVPEEDSLWQGECFVFDDRVTVNRRLEPGGFDQCHACRRPVSDADKAHPAWEPGVSCPRCIEEKTDAQRSGFAERRRQMLLAAARGEPHLGDAATGVAAQRREVKQSARAQQRQFSRDRN